MAGRRKPTNLVAIGIGLLVLSLVGSFMTQALLGQQQSAAMANLPLALFNVLGFAFSTAQFLGVALIAVHLGIRATRPAAAIDEQPSEPVITRHQH